MIYRIYFLILCLLVALPAFADRYSSVGEVFFVGALQGLFFMLVFGAWKFIKGNNPEDNKTQSQDNENATSKVVQPRLSAWEIFKAENTYIAKEVESLTKDDTQLYLSEKDIFEKIATFKRMSKHFDCPISKLKNVTVNIFVSKFNVEELKDVVDLLTVKSETESRKYCISKENTMSYYIKIWLTDYLYNTPNIQ